MSWLINSLLPFTPMTACKAELRVATEEEIKRHTKPKTWLNYIDKIVNSVSLLVFRSYSTIYSFVLKRSPDVGFIPGSVNVHVTKNPNVIKEILKHHRNDPNGFFSHAIVLKAMTQMMIEIYPKIKSQDMILTCGPEDTRIYRTFLKIFFAPHSIEKHLGHIQNIILKFSNEWKKNPKALVLNQETKLLATAVMAEIFLGFSERYDKISAGSSNIILWTAENSLLMLSWLYKMKVRCFPSQALISSATKDQTKKLFYEAIDTAIKLSSEPEARPSLVKEMLDSKNFSPEQIQAMILTLFVAGQDNVATSLSHVLLKLAQSKELQKKIREENISPLQSPLIRGLLCESLRVLCPVAGIGRTVSKTAVMSLSTLENGKLISETLIPEGDHLSAMMKFTAKDPLLYRNPEKFDIYRHYNQGENLTNLPHLPFGYGTHTCPGWYLYYAISALTITHLVKNYELSTTFEGEPQTKIRFVTQLDDSLTINLHPLYD